MTSTRKDAYKLRGRIKFLNHLHCGILSSAEGPFGDERPAIGKAMRYGLSIDLQHQVDKGIAILKQGGVIAFPTDTVYGLGACANIGEAVRRVYQLKERPRHLALPLLLADVSQLSEYAEHVPECAWILARKFMPGALTLVLPKSSLVSDIVSAGGNTVALRVPAHPVPLALVKGLGGAIVGTSANKSGMPSALTAEEVRAQLGEVVDLVIDGGPTPGGTESTIIDVTGASPVIVREGAIAREEIACVYQLHRYRNFDR